ncbi:MAG: hypothetical protein JST73_02160 [Actinobacteria bacterium]|nr:hypothetical protein [Actinomycetota bacterium]
MRRLSTLVVGIVMMLGGVASLFAPSTAAAEPGRASVSAPVATTGAVQVVKISGILDPVVADFLQQSLVQAQRDRALAVVLRVDSTTAVVSDHRIRELAAQLHSSRVPVIGWVGPSGSRAAGAMAQLLATVDAVGVAPGSAVGNFGPDIVPPSMWSKSWWEHRDELRNTMIGPTTTAAKGLTMPSKDSLVLRNVLLQIHGFHATNAGGVTATPVQFVELPLTRTMLHTFASPAVTALLLAIGLSLLLFEYFTAGVGVAGVSGAVCLVFAFYGLAVLPVRPVAVVVVVVSMLAFAVDVQVGVPRVWTAIGSVLFAGGFLLLFDGVATPWPATIGSIAGVIVAMVYGMPAMTRSRFSTPVIDRRWLVGKSGIVVGALAPVGVVRVDDALWAARTDGAVEVGTDVRVAAVDGVVCVVEPVTGAGSSDVR